MTGVTDAPTQELRAQQALRVQLVQLVRPPQRELLALRVRRVPRVPRALRVPLVWMVRQRPLELRALRARLEIRVPLV